MTDWKAKFDDVKSLYEQILSEKKVLERELGHFKRREPLVQMLWGEIIFLRKALQKAMKMGLRIAMDVPNTRIEDEQPFNREMVDISALGVLQATMGRDTWTMDEERRRYYSATMGDKWASSPSRNVSQADMMGVEKWLPSDGTNSAVKLSRKRNSWRRGGVLRGDNGISMSPYSPLAFPSRSDLKTSMPMRPDFASYSLDDSSGPEVILTPAKNRAASDSSLPSPPSSPPASPRPPAGPPPDLPPPSTATVTPTPPPDVFFPTPPGTSSSSSSTSSSSSSSSSSEPTPPPPPPDSGDEIPVPPAPEDEAPPAPPMDDVPMAPPLDGDDIPMAPPDDGDGIPMAPDMGDGIPAAPGMGGGGGGGSLKPTKKVIKPTTAMKALHWKRVIVGNKDAKLSNSLWARLDSINSGIEKSIDTQELEALFSKNEKVPEKKAGKGGKGGKDAKDGKGDGKDGKETKEAPQKAILLEPKRHNQLAIMLSQMPPFERIAEAVLNLDSSKLNRDQLEALYKNVPTTDEIKLVQQAAATLPKEALQGPEKFILALSQVPQLAARVDCWRFSLSFDEVYDDIYKPLDDMHKACNVVLTSKEWQKLMSVILCVGNYLNGNTRRGQADGFHLEILSKLSRIKDNTGGVSLLDYMLKICAKQFGKDFTERLKKEFEVVKTVQQYSLKNISAEGRKLMGNARLNQKMHSLVTGSSQLKDDKFDKIMGKFNTNALKRVDALAQKVKDVYADFVKALLYHEPDMPQEEAEQYQTEDFFQLIWGFVSHCHFMYTQQVAKEEAQIKKQKQEEAMQALKNKKPQNKTVPASAFSSPSASSPSAVILSVTPTAAGSTAARKNLDSKFGGVTSPAKHARIGSGGPVAGSNNNGSAPVAAGSASPTSRTRVLSEGSAPMSPGLGEKKGSIQDFGSPKKLQVSTKKSPPVSPTNASISPKNSPKNAGGPESPRGRPESPKGAGTAKKKKKILWQAHKDDEGNTYYYNVKTGASVWEKPATFPY